MTSGDYKVYEHNWNVRNQNYGNSDNFDPSFLVKD